MERVKRVRMWCGAILEWAEEASMAMQALSMYPRQQSMNARPSSLITTFCSE